jgi:hypothetical protein
LQTAVAASRYVLRGEQRAVTCHRTRGTGERTPCWSRQYERPIKRQARIAAGTRETVVSREDHVIGWRSAITGTGATVRNYNQQASGTAVPAIGTTTLAADNAGAMQSRDDGWAGAVTL